MKNCSLGVINNIHSLTFLSEMRNFCRRPYSFGTEFSEKKIFLSPQKPNFIDMKSGRSSTINFHYNLIEEKTWLPHEILFSD
jgi:hypothetical protein